MIAANPIPEIEWLQEVNPDDEGPANRPFCDGTHRGKESFVAFGRKTGAIAASLVLAASGATAAVVATSVPARAVVVPNMMLCEPDTGWCYQTNPPVNHSVPHYCQWDYRLHNLHSGMWYTGCNTWVPSIH